MRDDPTVLGVIARELMHAVAGHVRKYPRWLQPIALVCSTLLACCLVICAAPVFLLLGLSRWGRKHSAGMQALKLGLGRLWAEKSPQAAVRRLREILVVLERTDAVSVVVEPYGRLWPAPAIAELWPMLYEYEATLKNWEGGLEVADRMIKLLRPEDAAYWHCAKARCLIELGCYGEARQFVFAIRNPEHQDPELEELLSEAKRRAS